MDTPRLSVGGRIAHYRHRNGNRSQAAIAGLCGISERYLSMVENGKRIPSHTVLVRLAAELGVPVAALLTDDTPPEPAAPLTIAPDVARALMGHRPPAGTTPAAPLALRERVEQAWSSWQTSEQRFTDAASTLPSLISHVEHAVRAHRHSNDPTARRETLRTAADLYGLLRSYCRRTGRLDLSLMAADRAMRAAEDADDPVRIAAASWNLGHVLLSDPRDGAIQEASDVALTAAARLKHDTHSAEATAMQGALELVAVVADARQHHWWQARERLDKRAKPLGKEAGDGNVAYTVFGPTNVHLHALSIEMLAGQASDALTVADGIDTSQLPSREREFTFTLEVARCYAMRRDDAGLLVHLLRAEELSAEDFVRSPAALDLLAELRRRVRPTYRGQVEGLARRVGLD
ncbi:MULTISPECIES: helix-turn-helix transcriptional regulator [unclassified Streptomyces]|uniref:helix-turn-helix domain-containing protein n=1 Tax=unclassified Streptomyces TaxID=2593676 RepID=UPI003407E848